MTNSGSWIVPYKERINSALESLLPDDDSILTKAIRYSVLNGGKRLRPLLVYLSSELGNSTSEAQDLVSSAVELIHCYSLIHDDLPSMDDDSLRRGLPTCHKKFGEAIAILAGDALQPMAYSLLTHSNEIEDKLKVTNKSLLNQIDYLGKSKIRTKTFPPSILIFEINPPQPNTSSSLCGAITSKRSFLKSCNTL